MFTLDDEDSAEKLQKAQSELEIRLQKNNNLHSLNTTFVQMLEF